MDWFNPNNINDSINCELLQELIKTICRLGAAL